MDATILIFKFYLNETMQTKTCFSPFLQRLNIINENH